jgi:hypothetical protein
MRSAAYLRLHAQDAELLRLARELREICRLQAVLHGTGTVKITKTPNDPG